MPSIFIADDQGPLCPYKEMTSTDYNSLPVGEEYYGFLNCNIRCTELAFKSTLDVEVEIFLQNPADPNKTKWPWIKIDSNQTFSLQSQYPPQCFLPAHTWLWVKPVGPDLPTSGKLSLTYWGG